MRMARWMRVRQRAGVVGRTAWGACARASQGRGASPRDGC